MFKNRREFGKALLGIGMTLGLVKSASAALPDRTYHGPGATIPSPPPPDTRTPEEIVNEDNEREWKGLLISTESTSWRRYRIYCSRNNFTRLMAMDLPIQNINGQDYVIRNGWPITYFSS